MAVSQGLACGVHEDGCSECWGSLAGSPAGDAPDVDLVRIDLSPGNSDFEFEHGCGLTDQGEAVCWGQDLDGEATAPTSEYFESVATGTSTSCGVTSAATICWGWPDLVSNAPVEPVGGLSANGMTFVGSRGETVVYWDNVGTNSWQVQGLRFVGSAGNGGIYIAVGDELQFWHDGTGPVDGATFPLREDALFVDPSLCTLSSAGEIDCSLSENIGSDFFHPAPSGTFRSMDSDSDSACAVRTDGHVICWGYLADGGLAPPGSYTGD